MPLQELVQIIDRVKQVQMEQVCGDKLQKWMKEAVDAADSDVHRSRRHRDNACVHAIERGEDPDAAAAEGGQENPAAEGVIGQNANQQQNDA